MHYVPLLGLQLTGNILRNYILSLIEMDLTPKEIFPSALVSDLQSTCSLPQKFINYTQHQREFELPTLINQKECKTWEDRVLRRREFEAIRDNRARLVDWSLQIFAIYQLGWECFWMNIELVDLLIADFDYVGLHNIQLVAITSCFITAKLMGSKNLNLRSTCVGLGHSRFSQAQILKEEQNILKIVFERSNFQRRTIYSYLLDRYDSFPAEALLRAMRMMATAWIRPDMAFDALRVGTYRELVDFVMREVFGRRVPSVILAIEEDVLKGFKSDNIKRYGNSISL